MDVLEAPQLMDTCVRNGNYDDALDLRAFVAKLLLIHPNLQVSILRQHLHMTSESAVTVLATPRACRSHWPSCCSSTPTCRSASHGSNSAWD